MKTLLKTLFFFSLLAFYACNDKKDLVYTNDWIAKSITHANGVFETPNFEYLFIVEKKNEFSLRLDINTCGGNVKFGRKTVEFKNDIFCTEVCCDSDFALSLINKLPTTEKWTVEGNLLILENENDLKIVLEKKNE